MTEGQTQSAVSSQQAAGASLPESPVSVSQTSKKSEISAQKRSPQTVIIIIIIIIIYIYIYIYIAVL